MKTARILLAGGFLYGTTTFGGTNDAGAVFRAAGRQILRAAAGRAGQAPCIECTADGRHSACMFYFFRRNGSSIRCEVRADSAGDGYELIVDRPNATLTVEHFGAPPELNRRWREIERTLVREGWQGPHAKGN